MHYARLLRTVQCCTKQLHHGRLNPYYAAVLLLACGLLISLPCRADWNGFAAGPTLTVGNAPAGITTGHFSRSGHLDLAVTNSADNTVSIFLGNGDGTFRLPVTFSVGTSPRNIVAGDYNRDGLDDLLVTNSPDLYHWNVQVYLSNGDGTFTLKSTIGSTSGCGVGALAVGDFTGSGILDFATTPRGCGNKSAVPSTFVYLGNGDGTFNLAWTSPINSASRQDNPTVVGDFNGDGRLDILVYGYDLGSWLFAGNGDGTFTYWAKLSINGATGPQSVAVGEFNRDGRLDFAKSPLNLSVFLNNGTGFSSSPSFSYSHSYLAVAVGDFNKDGIADVVAVDNLNNNVAVFLGNGDGTFSAPLTYSVGSAPVSIVIGDFNEDAVLDLAVVNQSSNSVTILLGQRGASITTISGPASFTYPQIYPVSITVSPNGGSNTPTGNVSCADNGNSVGSTTLSNGSATLNVSGLIPGPHSFVCTYAGDSSFTGSTSNTLNATESKANSSVALGTSGTPGPYGQPVTFTATVSGGFSGESVTFYDGGSSIGTGAINSSGKATLTTSSLSVGNHTITGSYAGDVDYNGSTSSGLTQTVNQASTTTSVSSSANPSVYGQSVAFTCAVSPSAATGTCTIKDGGNSLGTCTLSLGSCTYSTTSLSVGSHAITVTYGGNSNYTGSTSGPLTQSVNKANVTITVTANKNPASYGDTVTFTGTVTGSAVTPTGTVTFSSSLSWTPQIATLDASGNFAMATATLPAGSNLLTITYGGDANYQIKAVRVPGVYR